MPHRPVSEAGLQLLMSFEGCRHYAARLADGRWTIGYGHTRSARKGAVVTQADARALLLYDLIEVSPALESLVQAPLNQNQFDALACFVFNIGLDNFRQSAVLPLVNAGAMLAAAHAIEQWREAVIDGEAVVVGGLVRRRAAEKALFLAPPAGWEPVPTALVQPQLDRDPDIRGLLNGFVEVQADLAGAEARVERVFPHGSAATKASEPEEVAPFPATPSPRIESEPSIHEFPVETPAQSWGAERASASAPPPLADPPPPSTETAEAPIQAQPPPLRTQLGRFEYETVEPDGGYWPWLGLGLGGIAVFAFSILWALNAHGPRDPFSPQVIGTLLALAGVACVVCAVYSLVQRYLGHDD